MPGNEPCTLVICLTDGLGEQKHPYGSRREAMRRYNTVCNLLKGGAYRERGIKVKYAYLLLGDKRQWIKKG